MKWTQEEIKLLSDLYSQVPLEELSSILNRSVYSIKSKVKKLKLSKAKELQVGFSMHSLYLLDKPSSRKIGKCLRHYGLFKCSCGNMKEIRIDNVLSGRTKTCGRCGEFRSEISLII